MIRLIPASRAMVVAAALVLATTALASAEETGAAAPAAEPAKPAKPFMPTIYVGPAFGYADQSGGSSEFGWGMHVLARPLKYAGIQIEYFNLGGEPNSGGELDGVYFGIAPILPLSCGVSLFGQVGAAFSDAGDDVAGGGGVLYDVPVEFLSTNKVDLTLRLDYKYFNLDDGEHLLTLGVMLGFHK